MIYDDSLKRIAARVAQFNQQRGIAIDLFNNIARIYPTTSDARNDIAQNMYLTIPDEIWETQRAIMEETNEGTETALRMAIEQHGLQGDIEVGGAYDDVFFNNPARYGFIILKENPGAEGVWLGFSSADRDWTSGDWPVGPDEFTGNGDPQVFITKGQPDGAQLQPAKLDWNDQQGYTIVG